VTTFDTARQEVAHRWPSALPDGRRFLYYIESADPAHAGTYVGDIGSALKQRVFDLPAVYQDGHLLFVREGGLYAQPIDLDTYALGRAPVELGGDAAPLEITTAAAYSAAPGLLAYSGANSTQRLTWYDRSGTVAGQIDGPSGLYNPFLARDGATLLAATGTGGSPRAIWTIDLLRGAPMRLTVGMRPLASPDGSQVAFTDDRATGVADVYLRRAVGTDDARLLLRSPENKMVDDWAPDAEWLLVSSAARTTKTDLWMVPVSGAPPRPLVQTAANELHGRLSPDGRWLAYASDETGELEVYVQAVNEPGRRQPVSVSGGTEPRWRGDGRELFFLGADLSVMAVDVTPGPALVLGQPRRLFRVPMARARSLYINHYDAAADGSRFVIQSPERNATPPLMVLLNWRELLPR
jgi:hypothetical protein